MLYEPLQNRVLGAGANPNFSQDQSQLKPYHLLSLLLLLCHLDQPIRNFLSLDHSSDSWYFGHPLPSRVYAPLVYIPGCSDLICGEPKVERGRGSHRPQSERQKGVPRCTKKGGIQAKTRPGPTKKKKKVHTNGIRIHSNEICLWLFSHVPGCSFFS